MKNSKKYNRLYNKLFETLFKKYNYYNNNYLDNPYITISKAKNYMCILEEIINIMHNMEMDIVGNNKEKKSKIKKKEIRKTAVYIIDLIKNSKLEEIDNIDSELLDESINYIIYKYYYFLDDIITTKLHKIFSNKENILYIFEKEYSIKNLNKLTYLDFYIAVHKNIDYINNKLCNEILNGLDHLDFNIDPLVLKYIINYYINNNINQITNIILSEYDNYKYTTKTFISSKPALNRNLEKSSVENNLTEDE